MSSDAGILKSPQGVVEIVLRFTVAALGLGALISASIAVDGTAKNDDLFKVEKSTELVVCTLGAGGETIGIAAIAMVSQVAIIVLRILNVCEKKKKVFLVVDIILSVFLVLGYLAGGISAAYFSAGWAPVPSVDPLGIGKIMASLIATAVLSLLSAIVCAILIAWMVLVMRKNRDEKNEKVDHAEDEQLQS